MATSLLPPALVGSAVFLLLCAYFGTTTATAVPLMTMAVAFNGFSNSAWIVNILDIAPMYAGAVMGIVNFAGNITGFLGPHVAKAIAITVSQCGAGSHSRVPITPLLGMKAKLCNYKPS